MQYWDYDKVTDTLLYLSSSVILEFTLLLSRKNKNGKRTFFHSEVEYDSNYINEMKSRNINRYMKYFFVINDKKDYTCTLALNQGNVFFLLKTIETKIFPWFFGDNNIFQENDGKLEICGKYDVVCYIQSEYKSISFEPSVVETYNNKLAEGIRITLCNSNDPILITLDKFIEFYSILKNTDMYNVASTMAVYAKCGPYNIYPYKINGLGGNKISTTDNNKLPNNGNNKGNTFLKNI